MAGFHPNVPAMTRILPFIPALLLAACSTDGPGLFNAPLGASEARTRPAASPPAQPAPAAPAPAPERIAAAPPARLPAQNAQTVEEFDTTTAEERAEAVVEEPAAESGDGRLGTTVASLGDAGEPGFWIKTPLVSEAKPGRLFYATSGRTVQVQLIPAGSGGSQVSLAAMRLLDAPLDGLPELVVYAN